jgi:hypothetical protein
MPIAGRLRAINRKLLSFFIEAKSSGKSLLNRSTHVSCTDFLDCWVDRNAYKQTKYLAGTSIPIFTREICRNQTRLCARLARELQRWDHV